MIKSFKIKHCLKRKQKHYKLQLCNIYFLFLVRGGGGVKDGAQIPVHKLAHVENSHTHTSTSHMTQLRQK